MGAQNRESNSSNFYKLKEDKDDQSKSKGELRFFKQEKKGDSWQDAGSYNQFEGTLIGVEVKEFEYEGKKRESLQLKFNDGQTTDVITLGFDSIIARNILNGLAGEAVYGMLSFGCGKPKEHNGKSYPTLYVRNNNEMINWKYSNKNGNMDQVPKVEMKVDDDGNSIKIGVKKANQFWKDVITKDILPKLANVKVDKAVASETSVNDFNGPDDLPF